MNELWRRSTPPALNMLEEIATPIHLTPVGTLSRVGKHMALEVVFLCSSILTLIRLTSVDALIHFFSGGHDSESCGGP